MLATSTFSEILDWNLLKKIFILVDFTFKLVGKKPIKTVTVIYQNLYFFCISIIYKDILSVDNIFIWI